MAIEMGAFEAMRKHYQHRDLAAREWKRKGGKVAGYFGNNVPEEMILAAGFSLLESVVTHGVVRR